jgi:predicted oxidoreductase
MQYHVNNTIDTCLVRQKNLVSLVGICVLYRRDPLAHPPAGNLDAQPDKIRKTAGLVQEYARRHETTAEGILLAWLLKHPAKIQPVLGTTTRNRLRACAKFP